LISQGIYLVKLGLSKCQSLSGNRSKVGEDAQDLISSLSGNLEYNRPKRFRIDVRGEYRAVKPPIIFGGFDPFGGAKG
jgi:hypothetical protein